MGNCENKGYVKKDRCPVPSGYIKNTECQIPSGYIKNTECQIPSGYIKNTECQIPSDYIKITECSTKGYILPSQCPTVSCNTNPSGTLYTGNSFPSKFNIYGKYGFVGKDDPISLNGENLTLSSTVNSLLWSYDVTTNSFVDSRNMSLTNTNTVQSINNTVFTLWPYSKWNIQKFTYDFTTKEIKSVLFPTRCMTDMGNGTYLLKECTLTDDQKFYIRV